MKTNLRVSLSPLPLVFFIYVSENRQTPSARCDKKAACFTITTVATRLWWRAIRDLTASCLLA